MSLTFRQRAMKLVYPLIVWANQKTSKMPVRKNDNNASPPVPFHSLRATLNNGQEFAFEKLKGKKVLLVNTASDCGLTPQYAELQQLYQHAKEDLEILAFPANDFKEQEKGSDEEIAGFCSRNFGVSFPLAKKSVVVKTSEQHPVFRWLTDAAQNGWNSEPPSWNFSKYLVDEDGLLTHCFDPALSPLAPEVTAAVNS